MEAARDIALALGGETDLDRVLELIAKRARTLVDAHALLIWLSDRDVLRLAAVAGNATPPVGAEILLEHAASSTALRSGKSVDTVDLPSEIVVDPAQFGRDETANTLIVPLVFRGRSLGVLAAFDPVGRTGVFSDDDERALRSFAASAATAVATARSDEAQRLGDLIGAAEGERGRWARDLHDETLQGLGAVKLALSAALRAQPVDAREQIEGAVAQLEREIRALRDIIADLRPPALDELGLQPAIRTLAERVAESHGLRLELRLELGERRLEAEAETTAYRVAQEALTNVVKHAAATCVSLELWASTSALELRVRDDGQGLGPPARTKSSGGYGLIGMRERAVIGGGTLSIDSRPGGGTTVTLILPTR